MTESLPERLTAALPGAIKSRDRAAVAALRSALSAIANAEAADVRDLPATPLSIEQSPTGAGATEVERRVLSDDEVRAIVQREVDDRLSAADDYARLGRSDRAAQVRAEAAALVVFLALE